MTPKFLAARSAAGEPNVVPLISLPPTDDQPDLLLFGNFIVPGAPYALKDTPLLTAERIEQILAIALASVTIARWSGEVRS